MSQPPEYPAQPKPGEPAGQPGAPANDGFPPFADPQSAPPAPTPIAPAFGTPTPAPVSGPAASAPTSGPAAPAPTSGPAVPAPPIWPQGGYGGPQVQFSTPAPNASGQPSTPLGGPTSGQPAPAPTGQPATPPAAGFGPPPSAYGQPAPVYGQPYGQPPPNAGQPAPAFGQPAPNFDSAAPAFGQPTSTFGGGAPAFGQPTPAFGDQSARPGNDRGYGPPDAFANDPFERSGFGDDISSFADEPRRGRGLLVGMIALAVIVLVGGGITAFLLVGRSQGTGVARPEEAVNQFLTAVYKDKDASAAEKVVCASSRDSGAISKRIKQLRTYERKYKSPSYSWPTPTVESRSTKQATVTVPLKVATSDDRVAEQRLKFLTVKGNGWLVCEVNAAS